MDVHLSPEQTAQLTALASAAGKEPEQLAQDILVRTLAEDATFRAAVQRGLDQADRGEFIDDSEMDARIRRMLHL